MDRRQFLTASAVAAVGLGLEPVTEAKPGVIARRPFGKGGTQLSIVGFGGIVLMGHDDASCSRMVAEAVERGINYFDVAPAYGNGEAETKLGPALKPHRKKVFLACKTGMRDAAGAKMELDRSLDRLKTDYLDLYQLHGLTTVDEVTKAFGPGGCMEVMTEAKQSGRVHRLGFSAHSVEAALAAIEQFPFDSILFPFNWVAYNHGNFGPQVMAAAQKANVARLALKAMAVGPWPENANKSEWPKAWYQPVTDPEDQKLAVRFTLSLPVTAVLPPGDIRLFRRAVEIAQEFKPLTAAEREKVVKQTAGMTPLFTAKA